MIPGEQHDSATLRRKAAELVAQGRVAEALPLLWEAASGEPGNPMVLNDLGNLLVRERRTEEGLAMLLLALERVPDEAKLHSNVGLALGELGRFEEALAAQHVALRLEPGLAAALTNMGNLLMMMGRPGDALGYFERALEADPGSANAVRNRAIALLAAGNLAEGFRGYEKRWVGGAAGEGAVRWQGEPLEGKRILVVAEQGIGDVIHFVRYARELKKRGATVLLECPALLAEILATAPGVDEILAPGTCEANRWPLQFDFHAPMMSLPHLCGTTLETIPATVPYLAASAERQAYWTERMQLKKRFLNVGIVWQGNPHHQWDRFRSVPLEMFAGLSRLEGVKLFSLQRGPGVEQIAAFQAATGGAISVPTNGVQEQAGDLADSAAIVSLLDAVITVDSAPAHLAGALAKNVWVLLSVAADWRWMTDRTDSPWYPTMRLFRQREINAWGDVFVAVEGALRERAAAHAAAI